MCVYCIKTLEVATSTQPILCFVALILLYLIIIIMLIKYPPIRMMACYVCSKIMYSDSISCSSINNRQFARDFSSLSNFPWFEQKYAQFFLNQINIILFLEFFFLRFFHNNGKMIKFVLRICRMKKRDLYSIQICMRYERTVVFCCLQCSFFYVFAFYHEYIQN